MGWRIARGRSLKGHERSRAAISDFLAKRFVAEAGDIALDEVRAGELFDRTELTIALQHAHQRGQGQEMTWMPPGFFVWKNRGQWLEGELKKVEGLSDDDPFFKAGLMGGGKDDAGRTVQKIRRWLQQLYSGF